MIGKKTLLPLLILVAAGCEPQDLDREPTAPEASAWRAGEIQQIDVTTFNGDISFTSGPVGFDETAITKHCRGGGAQDVSSSADYSAPEIGVQDRSPDQELASPQSNGCKFGADFDIFAPAAVLLDLENANGNISVDGLAGEARLETANGNIIAENLEGSIQGQVTNGNIQCDMAVFGSAQSAILSSTNGDITLLLPADVSAVFEASALNGTVTVSGFGPIDFILDEPSRKAGTIGSGLARVSILSRNGDVMISPC